MSTKNTLGFIGLGLMGSPMTSRLLEAGFRVSVWNRDPKKMDRLISQGALGCGSITELVQQSEIIMLCVSDTQAVSNIVFAEDGIASSINSNQLVIDFSSIDPEQTTEFAKKLQSLTKAQWVDCPVSGGVAGAESGNLVMMAGGNEAIVNRIEPLLKNLAQRVTYMGPVGSGQMTKVCNQMIVSCNVLVLAEVLALAKRSGVDAAKIPQALKGGFADSIPLQLTGTRMVNNDFNEIKWHVKTLLKDLSMASTLAQSSSSHTPMAELARNLMSSFSENGYASKDPANLIKPYLEKGSE